MMSDLVKINFYFPESTKSIKNKQRLVALIMDLMHREGTLEYAGYINKKRVQESLLRRIGKEKINQYRNLSFREKYFIEKTIYKTVQECSKILSLPTKNFIFVFPWFPSKEEKIFNGSFGFTVYSCVLHLFVAPDLFIKESIADSITHELAHTISYYYHFDRYGKWTLLDHIINEGLAENFREIVLHTKPAPWATLLTREKAFEMLNTIRHKLHSKDYKVHQKVMFGCKKYKRWTGYSIGYWIVKDFYQLNKNLSWEKIIKTKPEDIFKCVLKR